MPNLVRLFENKLICLILVCSTTFFLIGSEQAIADVLNQNQSFFIDTQYDYQGRNRVAATLRQISNRAYGYVEDQYWNNISQNARDQIVNQISDLLKEFDGRIYPNETQFFGSEPNPGIDNDPKITILFTPLITKAGGYFNTANAYPKTSVNDTSNEREMFYINISSLSDPERSKAFLAHEFQHLISLNQKEKKYDITDDTWLNELRSEYAISLLGYNDNFTDSNLDRRLQSFLANPTDSLTEWKNLSADYGQVAIFGQYLANRSSSKVIADTIKNDQIGINSLSKSLVLNGFSDSFKGVFKDWSIANYLNDPTVASQFSYQTNGLKNFRVTPTKVFNNLGDNINLADNGSFKDWQTRWYEISQFAPGQKRFLKIKFSSPSLTSFYIPYIEFRSDGNKQVSVFTPDPQSDTLIIEGISDTFNKLVFMPIKKDKIVNFGVDETPVSLSFAIERAVTGPATIAASANTTANAIASAKPAEFGLKEGDFIRADGDNDVYIVNESGYKRLVLNPAICLQYTHLTKRGCFGAIKNVSPAVRDAFKTSWYYTNRETNDGRVYFLQPVGDDNGALHWVKVTGDEFVGQGGDFRSVFIINTLEQKSYKLGNELTKLP